MKKAIKYLTDRPALFFLFAALIWAGVMFFINTPLEIQWKDIFVEADGMIFDLLVFGALLSWYDSKRQKNERIKQDENLVDDFRGWDEKEAMYRIVGAIKRLNKEGVTRIRLYRCFLSRADLHGADLHGADLSRANLLEANLWEANLSRADLFGANLSRADLKNTNLKVADLSRADLSRADLSRADLLGADLSGANLWEANLKVADLRGADLRGTNLRGADLRGADLRVTNLWGPDLSGANLWEANLRGAEVDKNWFEKLEEWEVIGREEIVEKYLIDETKKLQLK